MDYGIISRIEKAKMYAAERENRIDFDSFRVSMTGDNGKHDVAYEKGSWSCDCGYFQSNGYCSHTTAMERVLENMVEMAY
jgi:hypothetical protein